MNTHQFETPENIQVSYRTAGLGTRFLAWFVDNILLFGAMVVLAIVLVCTGILADSALEQAFRVEDLDTEDPEEAQRLLWYIAGVFALVWGLGSLCYFGLSEFLMRGQTLGKRLCSIEVVQVKGFGLDAGSVLIRNFFRIVDQLPFMWIVPVLSSRSQRLGDMVAGTIVVVNRPSTLNPLRDTLVQRPVAESRFRFSSLQLRRLRPQDLPAIEQILERWPNLASTQRQALLEQMIPPLAQRLEVDPPSDDEAVRFLQDLLAAEYRRQSTQLG